MKNFFKMAVFIALGILMTCSVTFADEATLAKTYEAVDRTNNIIDTAINRSVFVSDILVKNNVNPDVIINNLIRNAEQITAVTIDNAARNSVVVECEYVDVEIGGKNVLVDPCRVINY